MGFHICEFDEPEQTHLFFNTSSGDVFLDLEYQGQVWSFVYPDMLYHYVADHQFLPNQDFVNAVMHGKFVGGTRLQTKSPITRSEVGYLEKTEGIPTGKVPNGFLSHLMWLEKEAERAGMHMGTLSM